MISGNLPKLIKISVLCVVVVNFLAGCVAEDSGPLSILEWRVKTGNEIVWLEHVKDGEIYTLDEHHQYWPENRFVYKLKRYKDKKLIWEQKLPATLEGQTSNMIEVVDDVQRQIVVAHVTGTLSTLYIYDQTGTLLNQIEAPATINSVAFGEGGSLAVLTSDAEQSSFVVYELEDSLFVEKAVIEDYQLEPKLSGDSGKWIVSGVDHVMQFDADWNEEWQFDVDDPYKLRSILLNETAVVVSRKDSLGFIYFVDRLSGEVNSLQWEGLDSVLNLDEDGNAYLKSSNSNTPIVKINETGDVLFQTSEVYGYSNKAMQVEESSSGDIIVLAEAYESDFASSSYTAKVEYFDDLGSLTKRFSALAYTRTQNDPYCVEWCSVSTNDGYRFLNLFIDHDSDIYVYGIQPMRFFGKVDPNKFDGAEEPLP